MLALFISASVNWEKRRKFSDYYNQQISLLKDIILAYSSHNTPAHAHKARSIFLINQNFIEFCVDSIFQSWTNWIG